MEKKLKIQPSPNTRTDERTLTVLCVCVFVLQNILLHHPLFPAETFACPERFWRGHCEKHRMVKLCCCWTGTVQKCSGNKRSETKVVASNKAGWLGSGLSFTFRAQKIHESSTHLWVVSWRKLRRKMSRCHRTWARQRILGGNKNKTWLEGCTDFFLVKSFF